MKRFLRRWLPIYAPLSILAVASFQLPQPETPPQPAYLAAFEGAEYWRGEKEGGIKISAARIEQKNTGEIELLQVRMAQARGGGGIVLEGARGEARRIGENRQLQIAAAKGTIKNAGQTFGIQAEEVVYDLAAAVLSGKGAEISGEALRLRGDQFVWSAAGGLKVKGNVESFYLR